MYSHLSLNLTFFPLGFLHVFSFIFLMHKYCGFNVNLNLLDGLAVSRGWLTVHLQELVSLNQVLCTIFYCTHPLASEKNLKKVICRGCLTFHLQDMVSFHQVLCTIFSCNHLLASEKTSLDSLTDCVQHIHHTTLVLY